MKKLLAVSFVWMLVLGSGAAAFKILVLDPKQNDPNNKGTTVNKDKGQDKDKDKKPSNGKAYKLALDSFSGYCIFRSDEMKAKLASKGIDLELVDDGAKYPERMKALTNGSIPLAVFTIDALINTLPTSGNPPVSIIMMIDETRGADAMIAYKNTMPDIDSLNREDVKIVLTPDSPSETLTRVIRTQFKLPRLPEIKKQYLIEVDGASLVYDQFLKAKPAEPKAYVLWEPYVSLALKESNGKAHVLVDSSRFRGFIVDVLVVQQEFLQAHPDVARNVVQAYLETLQEFQQKQDGMVQLILDDAKKVDEKKLNTPELAEKVVKGIWWKNTMENYGHFGLLPENQSRSIQPIGEMIKNITSVLNKTKQPGEPDREVVRSDKLYDPDILNFFRNQQFQLGQTIRDEALATPISPAEWSKLQRVGTLQVEPIPFESGEAKLMGQAPQRLAEVAELLRLCPQYYLRVEGNTRGTSKEDAAFALKQTQVVRQWLINEQKVKEERILAVGMKPGLSKEVDFVVLQKASSGDK